MYVGSGEYLWRREVRIEAGLVYVGPQGMAVRLVNRVGPKMGKQVLVELRIWNSQGNDTLYEKRHIPKNGGCCTWFKFVRWIKGMSLAIAVKGKIFSKCVAILRDSTQEVGGRSGDTKSETEFHFGQKGTPVPKAKPRLLMVEQKAEVTYFECGNLGHYRKKCPQLKFLNRVDKYWKGKAPEDSSVTTSNVTLKLRSIPLDDALGAHMVFNTRSSLGAHWKEQLCLGSLKEAKESNLLDFCGYSAKHKLLQSIHCLSFCSSYLYLTDTLEITPIDQGHQFVSPPSGDAIMDFVNELRQDF
ncbi:hypothetical protein Tco_0806208 [Tanacetum coccineum]